MNKKIFLLILWRINFFVLIMTTIDAHASRLVVDKSYFEEGVLTRNPFEPQVPREVQVRRDPVEPIERPPEILPPPSERLPPVPAPPPPVEVLPPPVEVPLPDLKIAGVVWNTDRPQAIVDGKIVGIGDTVSGVNIVNIEKTGITISAGGRTATIKIRH